MRARRKSVRSPAKQQKAPAQPRNAKIKAVKIKQEIVEEETPPPPSPKKTTPELVEPIAPSSIKQELEETVCPPPEYCPLNLRGECPKINELLIGETRKNTISQVEMIRLQHDLEALLAFAGGTHNRAVGEVAFLTSGDYPIVDLSGRPGAVFANRFVPEMDDMEYTLDNLDQGKQVSLCGLPVDKVDDCLDSFPPNHIPTRFWRYCYDTMFGPIDAEFIRKFKAHFVDCILSDEFNALYINEPFKYRKREKPRGRPPASSKRKNKLASPEEAKSPPPKRKAPLRDPIYEPLANLVSIICKEELTRPKILLPLPSILKKVKVEVVDEEEQEVIVVVEEEEEVVEEELKENVENGETEMVVEAVATEVAEAVDSDEEFLSLDFARIFAKDSGFPFQSQENKNDGDLSLFLSACTLMEENEKCAPPVEEVPQANGIPLVRSPEKSPNTCPERSPSPRYSLRSPKRMTSPRVKLEPMDVEEHHSAMNGCKTNGVHLNGKLEESPKRRNGERRDSTKSTAKEECELKMEVEMEDKSPRRENGVKERKEKTKETQVGEKKKRKKELNGKTGKENKTEKLEEVKMVNGVKKGKKAGKGRIKKSEEVVEKVKEQPKKRGRKPKKVEEEKNEKKVQKGMINGTKRGRKPVKKDAAWEEQNLEDGTESMRMRVKEFGEFEELPPGTLQEARDAARAAWKTRHRDYEEHLRLTEEEPQSEEEEERKQPQEETGQVDPPEREKPEVERPYGGLGLLPGEAPVNLDLPFHVARYNTLPFTRKRVRFQEPVENTFFEVDIKRDTRTVHPLELRKQSSAGTTNYTLEEKIRHGMGEACVDYLQVKNLLPLEVPAMMPHLLGIDMNIDMRQTGKIDSDETDEVSLELMYYQEEMKIAEADIKGTLVYTWQKLLGDFAFHETAHQLDEADNTLFRLVVNTYNDFPRRFPKPGGEWSSVLTAISRRRLKVRDHYSRKLKLYDPLILVGSKDVEDAGTIEELY